MSHGASHAVQSVDGVWLPVAVFIGVTMGAAAFCVDLLLECLNNWKFNAVKAVIRARYDSGP